MFRQFSENRAQSVLSWSKITRPAPAVDSESSAACEKQLGFGFFTSKKKKEKKVSDFNLRFCQNEMKTFFGATLKNESDDLSRRVSSDRLVV